jgi:enoyl-CoA hydratase/carnithine racemase
MILTFDHGPVRELRLNRPPVNALSPDLIVALGQAVREAPGDRVRALVLSGSPGRFSGGLDVPLLLTLDRTAIAALWQDFYALLRALAASPIPIAAAITGHAPAGGTVLPLFCDWRVLADGDWKMGFNEVQVGLPLPPVILAALKIRVGSQRAERLAVGGILALPEEAVRLGLADEVVPAGRVVERAIEWCQGLLALPPDAMSQTRRRARADIAGLFDHNLDRELDQVTASWWSDEAQTVLHALVERLAKGKSG